MDNERILKKIEELLEQRGMTRYRLAKESGIKQSTLTTMLNKRSIVSIDSLNKISHAFGMRLSELISLAEESEGGRRNSDFPLLEWERLSGRNKRIIICTMKEMIKLWSEDEKAEEKKN